MKKRFQIIIHPERQLNQIRAEKRCQIGNDFVQGRQNADQRQLTKNIQTHFGYKILKQEFEQDDRYIE